MTGQPYRQNPVTLQAQQPHGAGYPPNVAHQQNHETIISGIIDQIQNYTLGHTHLTPKIPQHDEAAALISNPYQQNESDYSNKSNPLKRSYMMGNVPVLNSAPLHFSVPPLIVPKRLPQTIGIVNQEYRSPLSVHPIRKPRLMGNQLLQVSDPNKENQTNFSGLPLRRQRITPQLLQPLNINEETMEVEVAAFARKMGGTTGRKLHPAMKDNRDQRDISKSIQFWNQISRKHVLPTSNQEITVDFSAPLLREPNMVNNQPMVNQKSANINPIVYTFGQAGYPNRPGVTVKNDIERFESKTVWENHNRNKTENDTFAHVLG